MSTTSTTYEGFAKPDVGTEENSWGALLNTIFDQTDARLGGYYSQSVTGSATVSVSTANARFPIHEYSGTMSANTEVIVPTNTRIYNVYNNTSGTFSLTIKTSAGTGVAIPQGGRLAVLCDGTNVEQVNDATGLALLAVGSNLSDVSNAATAFSNIKQAATTSATGVLEIATDAEVSTGTATNLAVVPSNITYMRTQAKEWSATQNFNATTLTPGTSVSWDASANQVTSLALSTSGTLANPSNLVDGGVYILRVTQGTAGTNTLAYGTAYKWPGSTAPTITTTSNATDIISFVSDGTSMYGVVQQDFG